MLRFGTAAEGVKQWFKTIIKLFSSFLFSPYQFLNPFSIIHPAATPPLFLPLE
jgi:hypothetical protein